MVQESSRVDPSLERLRKGEMEALADVFSTYRPRLQQMLRMRMAGPLAARVDASDVLQETYLDATRKVQHYLNNPQVSTFVWLRGLTLDRLHKVQREHLGTQCRAIGREVQIPEGSSLLFAQQLVADVPSPSQAAMHDELRQRVARALMKLKEEDREVILMRHFEGLSNREVAEAFGLGISGATMRHGRALFRLKEQLQADWSNEESIA